MLVGVSRENTVFYNRDKHFTQTFSTLNFDDLIIYKWMHSKNCIKLYKIIVKKEWMREKQK